MRPFTVPVLLALLAEVIACYPKQPQPHLQGTLSASQLEADATTVALAFRQSLTYEVTTSSVLQASLNVGAFEKKVGKVEYKSGKLQFRYNTLHYVIYVNLLSTCTTIVEKQDQVIAMVARPQSHRESSFDGVTEAGEFPIYMLQGDLRSWSWCLVHSTKEEPGWPEAGGPEPTKDELERRVAEARRVCSNVSIKDAVPSP